MTQSEERLVVEFETDLNGQKIHHDDIAKGISEILRKSIGDAVRNVNMSLSGVVAEGNRSSPSTSVDFVNTQNRADCRVCTVFLCARYSFIIDVVYGRCYNIINHIFERGFHHEDQI